MSFTMTMIFNIDQLELVDTGLATGPKRTTPGTDPEEQTPETPTELLGVVRLGDV